MERQKKNVDKKKKKKSPCNLSRNLMMDRSNIEQVVSRGGLADGYVITGPSLSIPSITFHSSL